jgi:hypothetical protein
MQNSDIISLIGEGVVVEQAIHRELLGIQERYVRAKLLISSIVLNQEPQCRNRNLDKFHFAA